MKLNRSALITLFTDVKRKGFTDNMFRTLIESLWRDASKITPYDQDFIFCDIALGTAVTYILDPKATCAYTIDGIELETDDGTLTALVLKIGSTAVTGCDSITVDTGIDTSNATADNSVAIGERVNLYVPATGTGTPTRIIGKLLRTLV